MKIKNLEILEEQIDKDFTWRKMELFQLKMAIERKSTTLSEKTLIRSGIALLCAHWEGFIRTVANYYIVYISDQKVKIKDLKVNFIAFKLKQDILQSGQSKKNSVHARMLEKYIELQDKTFKIKFKDTHDERIINTESNLSYELFCEILKSLALDNLYETKKNYIENEMLKYRHEIVHGESYRGHNYDFPEVYKQVLSIMEDFKNQVIEAAENKSYLK